MNVKDAIKKRRAIKAYKPSKLAKEQLDQLMESTNLAPSPNNFQDSRIIVLQSDESKKKYLDGFIEPNHLKILASAAVFLFVGIPYRMMAHNNGELVFQNDAQYYGMPEAKEREILSGVMNYYDEVADYSETMDMTTSAIQASFLMLEATELGLGSTPIQGILKKNIEYMLIKDGLMQPQERVNLGVVVGKPDPDSKLFGRIRRPVKDTFKII